MTYIKRLLFEEIKRWIGRREIIAIKGPRQSGKTTMLEVISAWLAEEKGVDAYHIIYVTFEDRGELDAFLQDPKGFTARRMRDSGTHYFLIDEAQYCDGLGQKLKLIYDLFKNVKLIITGSSSLELRNQTGKFLVGRMLEFELLPLSFYEYLSYADPGLAGMYKEWNDKAIRLVSEGKGFGAKDKKDIFNDELLKHVNNFIKFGGYPAVAVEKGAEEKAVILKNLMNTYIDRDIVSFLHITDTLKFRKLVTAIAASDGSMIKLEELANQVGSYFKELTRLADVLEQTYIIRRVGPYHRNLVTELKKAHKAYFVDTGIRNSLIENFSDMDKRPDAGILAENFVLNELHAHSRMHFWRTTSNTEVDFVAEGRELLPIEVKFQHFSNPSINRSMYGFLDEYKPQNGLIITKDLWGERRYRDTKMRFMPIGYL
ncbi:MAG: ATP-binding protein [Candidatus Marsarchaeota archaeon]|nr:ATP-binding protein [Candidatus Marsarchaeota archaeon]